MLRALTFLFLVSSTAAFAAQPVVVSMKSISYEPKRVEIKAGEAIIWKNVSLTDHSATSTADPVAFDSGMIAPKTESKPITFSKPGEFTYFCHTHGRTMSGTVVVK